MRRVVLTTMCLVGLHASMASMVRAAAPPQRPFETLLPWSLDRGAWEVAFGAIHRRDVAPAFFGDEPGFRRDEWRLSLLDVTLGLGGGGEAQVQFGVQRFHEEDGLEKSGVQDARIAFSYEIPVRAFSAAVRFAAKLPNAANDDRLGTDEADVFLVASAGDRSVSWGWAANAGLGILGNPTRAGDQDDVLALGVAGWLALGRGPHPVWLLAEANGIAASRFTNDARYARAGVRLGGRLPVDLSVRRGLSAPGERWGIEAGLTLLR